MNLILSTEAVQDLQQAYDWYENEKQGLGEELLDNFEEKTQFIEQHPLASRIRYDNVRSLMLNRFPFALHYQVLEQENQILIIGIYHAKSNPEKWNLRLKK